MARTHKDRHNFKRKERRRTGKSDPRKIKLHRKRVVRRIKQQQRIQNNYSSIVFEARLKFFVEDSLTEVWVEEQKVDDIHFLVNEPEDCHYVVMAFKQDFNLTLETNLLEKHVRRVKFHNQPCRLMVRYRGSKICSSIIGCPHRVWNWDDGEGPECTL